MLTRGQQLRTENGESIEVTSFLANGGQGEVYRAKNGQKNNLVLKVFHDPGPDLEQRTKKLVQCGSSTFGSAVALPFDRVIQTGMIATVAPYVHGKTLESWLMESDRAGDLQTRLVLALVLVSVVESFHKIGWTPGDLGSDQFIVQDTPTHSEARLIDLDSFVAPGLPAPRTLGKPSYFSPEMRSAWLSGKPHPITQKSDIYSLGILLHEILLLRHPTVGHVEDNQPESYHEVLMKGWPDDPLLNTSRLAKELVGFPVALLDPNTQRILRLSLGPKPLNRPTAGEIKAVLKEALLKIHPCPACNCLVMAHENLACCPYAACGAAYAPLHLRGKGFDFLLDQPLTTLGRAELSSPEVSRRHLVLRRMGPRVEVMNEGMNGTLYGRSGSAWEALPNDRPIPAFVGDHFSLAGIQLQLTN